MPGLDRQPIDYSRDFGRWFDGRRIWLLAAVPTVIVVIILWFALS